METKTCKNTECKQDSPQPISNFRKTSQGNGISATCNSCIHQNMKKGAKRNKAKKQVTVDFKDYEYLWDALQKFALERFRSPEQVILSLIDNAVEWSKFDV